MPLEKGLDYLALPSGRQIQVPFDQLLVFSTNLEPRNLVDEAFLRRIPYKIEVLDPTVKEFCEIFLKSAAAVGLACQPSALQYLLEKHYGPKQLPLRYCHVRDLLSQVKVLCEFHDLPLEVTPGALDVAVGNYFGSLGMMQ